MLPILSELYETGFLFRKMEAEVLELKSWHFNSKYSMRWAAGKKEVLAPLPDDRQRLKFWLCPTIPEQDILSSELLCSVTGCLICIVQEKPHYSKEL